jgi:hypothetical protein
MWLMFERMENIEVMNIKVVMVCIKTVMGNGPELKNPFFHEHS